MDGLASFRRQGDADLGFQRKPCGLFLDLVGLRSRGGMPWEVRGAAGQLKKYGLFGVSTARPSSRTTSRLTHSPHGPFTEKPGNNPWHTSEWTRHHTYFGKK